VFVVVALWSLNKTMIKRAPFLQVWEQGLATAVGVSNFKADRVRKTARFLEGRGTCLASNQVQYSLLYRKPEQNGVMEACRWMLVGCWVEDSVYTWPAGTAGQ
jgi:aryl-alcohol dehydrogenase-like predicted oxidoreductase